MKYFYKLLYGFLITIFCCGQSTNKIVPTVKTVISNNQDKINNEKGSTLQTRFNTPLGFIRKQVAENSFAYYLRNLPLKPHGSKVKYYNGAEKDNSVYIAVIYMDIGSKDLQQCADAIMRLRGEYFYSQKLYDSIYFTLTNGFKVNYSEWIKGKRIAVNGNKTSWKPTEKPSNSYKDFRNFMDLVFTYAGTLSLSKSMKDKNIKDISIGDVFIVGGTPGHAIIVVDVAENNLGEKVFMLAQSYMPAQETQILKNFNDEMVSPWYRLNINENLETPEWTFEIDQVKTW